MTVYSSTQVNNVLEKIHLDFLINNFPIEPFSNSSLNFNNSRPDLVFQSRNNKPSLIELKSRTYPLKQKTTRDRPQSDFEWWKLDNKQIQDYTKIVSETQTVNNIYWIFLLGTTEIEAKKIKNPTEDSIQERDLYILPWETYKLVNVSNLNIRHLGLARLKKEYNFETIPITKGQVKIESSILSEVDFLFS